MYVCTLKTLKWLYSKCLIIRSPNLSETHFIVGFSDIQWMSENRTSGLENRTKKRPDFERPVIGRPVPFNRLRLSDRLNALGRPITGHKRPVIGRLLYLKRLKTGHLCPDFRHKPVWNRFQTGSKPVWNRFGTGFGTGFGYQTSGWKQWNRTSDNRRLKLLSTGLPEIRTNLSGFRTITR